MQSCANAHEMAALPDLKDHLAAEFLSFAERTNRLSAIFPKYTCEGRGPLWVGCSKPWLTMCEECCYIWKVPRVHSGLPVAVDSFAVRFPCAKVPKESG